MAAGWAARAWQLRCGDVDTAVTVGLEVELIELCRQASSLGEACAFNHCLSLTKVTNVVIMTRMVILEVRGGKLGSGGGEGKVQ